MNYGRFLLPALLLVGACAPGTEPESTAMESYDFPWYNPAVPFEEWAFS